MNTTSPWQVGSSEPPPVSSEARPDFSQVAEALPAQAGKDLTPRQAQILAFIQMAITTHGMPPTRAEIARKFNFKSPSGAEEHLRALERKGAIELIPNISRGIRLSP